MPQPSQNQQVHTSDLNPSIPIVPQPKFLEQVANACRFRQFAYRVESFTVPLSNDSSRGSNKKSLWKNPEAFQISQVRKKELH
ncbi:hypothetical protein Pan54_28850 [Rubinisphaera italica]|uniref:Uncharacterized protein n=1 Tax=Rubinisphaera italica TaxID=2527969 RepID=A0A5C5XJ16_9PLAN|nr:hypothetical protein Pan54_28850 [Rubinisphaera italica]